MPAIFLQNTTGFMVGRQIRGGRHRQGRRENGHGGGDRRRAQIHRHRRRKLRRRQLRDVRPRLFPRFLWMWPNARIGVMGGEQAASVLSRVRRDALKARGETWTLDEEKAFKAPIREQYERQGHPLYSSARLWDDGLIDPVDTRHVLGSLSLRERQRAYRGNEIRPISNVSAGRWT